MNYNIKSNNNSIIKTNNKYLLATSTGIDLSRQKLRRPPAVFPAPNRRPEGCPYRHPRTVHVRFQSTIKPFQCRQRAALSVCNKLLDRYQPSPALTSREHEGIIDSGASNHFAPTTYNGEDHRDDPTGVPVRVADDRIIRSAATDTFHLPGLPHRAHTCYKFPAKSKTLFSVGQVCDADMKVMFDRNYVHIYNPSGEIVLEGYRHPTSRLYMLPLPNTDASVRRVTDDIVRRVMTAQLTSPMHHGFSAYEVQSIKALVNFFHSTCLCPPISEWKQAVKKGYFMTFPGLTEARTQRHCSKKIETAKGHLRLMSSNVRSTSKPTT